MTQEEKDKIIQEKRNNRTKFRLMAIGLVTVTMLIGAGLAFSGITTAATFGSIAIGVMTFAGIVFGADYFSKVETD